MHRRHLTLVLVAIPAFAQANGAMGLGLEIFDLRYWTGYVVATVVFEAWMIGRWMGKGWFTALGLSLIANLVTAFACTSICAVGLHPTDLNPSPFLDVLALFFIFGVASALIESFVWQTSRWNIVYRGSVFLRTLWTHLLGIPLGLAILLIPSHPYVGRESLAFFWRWHYLGRYLERRLDSLEDNQRLPSGSSFPEIWNQVPPVDGESRDAWIAAYKPSFGRFSFANERGEPIAEWNRALSGTLMKDIRDGDQTWLIRRRDSDGSVRGIATGKGNNYWGFTTDPKLLGYGDSNRDQSPR
ncbi:MAG: hypothetical protein ACHQ50_13025 [Fimbriimonadales bacterium]